MVTDGWRSIVRSLAPESKIVCAVDLDGTLLHSDGNVSVRTADAIEMANAHNIEVIPCTARSSHSVENVLASVNAIDTCVIANGSAIWSLKSSRIIDRWDFKPLEPAQLISRAQDKFDDLSFGWETSSDIHLQESLLKMFDLQGTGWAVEQITDDKPRASEPGVLKVHLWSPTTSADVIAKFVSEHFDSFGVVLNQNNHATWLEVFGAPVDKGKALLRVTQAKGSELVLAVGDGVNDLSLLNATPWLFAVGNADAALKSSAVEVISSNDDDGVALWLEEITALRASSFSVVP